jgi:aromatic ring-cleaving dioxygenase
MFELNFSEIILTQVKSFFKNKTTYSILIHTDTECDIKDHTVGAEWLGEPLQLNFNFFEKIINDPDSRIHPIQKL